MMRIVFWICAALLFVPAVQAASFHCPDKIDDPMVFVICQKPEVGKADEDLAAYYVALRKALAPAAASALRADEGAWIKQRDKECSDYQPSCLVLSYGGRINALKEKYSQTVPLPARTAARYQGFRASCGFPEVRFPAQFKVYGAGAYAGRYLDQQIDRSGHQAARFDITVNHPDEPVVLLLGDYDPGIWNISWTPGTRILAVVVSGYARQIVLGLPPETPLIISRGAPCESSYIVGRNIDSLNRLSNKLFGRPTDGLFPANNGAVLIGAQPDAGTRLLASQALALDDFLDKAAPLAGPAGLAQAVKQGLIRKSDGSERKEWRRRWVARHPHETAMDKNLTSYPIIDPANTYVILKPFRIPPGLYGGLSAEFFLPDGVPFPRGDVGGATLYDLHDLKCYGRMCEIPCENCRE